MMDEMMDETTDETKVRLERSFGPNMVSAIRNWIDHGIMPGSFLTAVITNDLNGAVGAADHLNIRLIPEYVFYFYNYCPGNCWGSIEKTQDYQKSIVGF